MAESPSRAMRSGKSATLVASSVREVLIDTHRCSLLANHPARADPRTGWSRWIRSGHSHFHQDPRIRFADVNRFGYGSDDPSPEERGVRRASEEGTGEEGAGEKGAGCRGGAKPRIMGMAPSDHPSRSTRPLLESIAPRPDPLARYPLPGGMHALFERFTRTFPAGRHDTVRPSAWFTKEPFAHPHPPESVSPPRHLSEVVPGPDRR